MRAVSTLSILRPTTERTMINSDVSVILVWDPQKNLKIEYNVSPLASSLDLFPRRFARRSSFSFTFFFARLMILRSRLIDIVCGFFRRRIAGMKVTERISESPTPTAVKIENEWSGCRGLVINEMKPTTVVIPARRTAFHTSFNPRRSASSCISLVISPVSFSTST